MRDYDVPMEVRADLMEAVTSGAYGSLRVGELRKRLEERGLDIDGSKQAMINTPRENSS